MLVSASGGEPEPVAGTGLDATSPSIQGNRLAIPNDSWTVYGASGKREEASRMLKELSEMSNHQYVPSYYVALVYAGLDERDQAFKCLDKAVQERNGPLVMLNRDLMLAGLRTDPRFQELVQNIGLSLLDCNQD